MLGIEIPKGDPDELRSAAAVWAAMGDKLDAQAAAMDGAVSAVSAADWYGPASLSYSSASNLVASAYRDGAGACRLAASAARHHAVELEDARAAAKAAVRGAVDANSELSRQRKVAAGAHADRRVAEGRASEAAQRGSSARAAGLAGAGVATVADGEESTARGEASAAGEVAERAERRASEAGESLEDARRKGRRANEDAEKVGEKAAEVYREVAGRPRPPVLGISPAAPVSLRGASPTLAALGPFAAGSPFGPIGRYATPAQARAGQIAALRALAQDRERALEGGMADRFGGEFKGYTGFHVFGDPDTRGYETRVKVGELASWRAGSPARGWSATSSARAASAGCASSQRRAARRPASRSATASRARPEATATRPS